jgi:hypothetical protein
MPETTTTLRQHLLGTEPYVLLTFGMASNGEDVKIDVECGGGITEQAAVRDALLMALAEMGPFSDEEIDALREVGR